jgi:hypothetical protein
MGTIETADEFRFGGGQGRSSLIRFEKFIELAN